jgi:hypothetical protein
VNEKPNSESGEQQNKKPFLPGGLWYILAAGAILFGLLYRLSRVFTVTTEKYTFLVLGGANVLIFLAILVQALIYRRQWDAMTEAVKIERAKTDPRLQITKVRVVNLRPDESPIFLLSIRNVGTLDAEDTLISLRVSFGRSVDSEGTLAQKLTEPQSVTIPAGQEHTYAVPWDGAITKEHIERLHKVPLKMSGFIKQKGKDERGFCYRYYIIKGNRPEGMPEFVPCDFDTRLTKIVTAGSVRLKLEPYPPNVSTDKAQEHSKDEDAD